MHKKIKFTYIVCVLLLATTVMAQQFAPVGTAVSQFLEIGMGARAVAMGEAYTALTNDAGSVFWNPAGLSDVKNMALVMDYNRWPADISLGGIAVARNFGAWGTFALSGVYLSTNDMEVTTVNDPDGLSGATFNITNYAIGLSYARYMTEQLSVGVTLKVVSEKYWSYGYTTGAIDLGTVYHTGYHGLNIGMSILHFGPEVKFSGDYIDYSDHLSVNLNSPKSFESYSLPINFRFGICADLIRNQEHQLIGAIDMIHPNNNLEQYNSGFEYGYKNMFFLRGGYEFTSDEGGLNLGVGFNYSLSDQYVLNLDYAYSDMGLLTDVHRISFGFDF